MTFEEQVSRDVVVGNLIGAVEEFRNGGYRLVQISCTTIGDTFELNYSFDKDYRFENLRVTVPADTEIPSITGMYWGAFAYENELHDLFGLKVRGMNIDFGGNFIRTAVKHPFGPAPAGAPKGDQP